MSSIILTKRPKRGDAVLGNKLTNGIEFATHESMMEATLDAATYEYIGPVLGRKGKKVLYAYRTTADRKWSDRYSYKLTVAASATSGVLSVREASDSWAANHTYTISWTNGFVDDATHRAEVIEALNTYFAANAPFNTQDWYAEEVNNEIHVHFAYTVWQQSSYNTASSGFSVAVNLLPGSISLANIRRRNGNCSGEGVISSWERALAYFRADNSSTTYNPNTTVSSIAVGYPICLPGYLGKSEYRKSGDDYVDYCSALRAVFGEGEQGWIEFMKSCLPVYPSDWGNMGMRDGKARTQYLASQTYTSLTKTTPQPLCPAAYYCANVETAILPKGTFWLPTVEEVYEMLKGIKYSTINSREADVVNALQYKMGYSAINNGSFFWSSLRCYAYYAWSAYGNNGFFSNGGMYGAFVAAPVSLYELP